MVPIDDAAKVAEHLLVEMQQLQFRLEYQCAQIMQVFPHFCILEIHLEIRQRSISDATSVSLTCKMRQARSGLIVKQ